MDDAGATQIEAAEEVQVAETKVNPSTPAKASPKAAKTATPGKGSAAKKAVVIKASKPAALPWTFPKNTLEDAIKIARAIEEQNGGNPMKPDVLAKAVGYNSMADWRFLDLLRSANLYSLVNSSGKINPVGLTEIGQDVVAPSTPPARPKALMAAFRSVEDFRKVESRGRKYY